MSIPSDKEIKQAAAELLKGCDVATTTLKSIRKQLEERFNCSLSEKKEIIYESFDKFLALNEDLLKYNEVVEAESGEPDLDEEPKKKIKPKGGFAAAVHLSPDLAEFMGQDTMPRTEVTKRMWAYIKEHDLQDPRDKRKILCDTAMEKVLKRKSVHMFTMTKILSSMMKSTKEVGLDVEVDEEDVSKSKKSKKSKKVKQEQEAETDDDSDDLAEQNTKRNSSKSNDKKRKDPSSVENEKKQGTSKKEKKGSSFTISDGLCNLLGLQSDETRYQVVAKMWEYIRAHSLQNPADKREVKLDAAMQDVFKVKTFTIFSMNKHISGQIYKNDA